MRSRAARARIRILLTHFSPSIARAGQATKENVNDISFYPGRSSGGARGLATAWGKIALFRRGVGNGAQIAFPAERGSTRAEVPIVSLRRC